MSVASPHAASPEDGAPKSAAIVPRVGRPRDLRVDEAILNATSDLIAETGFGGVTVEAVAARAGVGKATIYRRWPSKESLILAAIRTVAPRFEPADTGSLQGDLTALLTHLVSFLTQRRTRCVLAAAMAEAVVDPDLRQLRDQFAKERRSAARVILERGRERGELRPDVDIEQVIDAITAPIFYRMLLKGRPFAPTEIEPMIDIVLHGIVAQADRNQPSSN